MSPMKLSKPHGIARTLWLLHCNAVNMARQRTVFTFGQDCLKLQTDPLPGAGSFPQIGDRAVNIPNRETRIVAVAASCEGVSIRAIER